MPELPEVEVVRAGLAARLTGRLITRVQVLHSRPVRRHLAGPTDFEQALIGQRFAAPRRRGKYLWLPLVDGDAVLVHLGMSGQFRINAPTDPLLPNTRVLLDLDEPADGHGDTQVRFVDQRMFGGLSISRDGAALPSEIAHIALDPFDDTFDLEGVARRMQSRHTTVKRALLDQTMISGIGNIYADEALWRARTHYNHPTDELSTRRARGVLRAAKEVMSDALLQGGTSFDSLYVNVNGSSGYFSRSLQAYGREGLPCSRCGTSIVREAFMNRSSHRCPRCQPRPSRGTFQAGLE